MASGRLFQVRGPATANDLSPNEVCVRGTRSFLLSADLIPGRRSAQTAVAEVDSQGITVVKAATDEGVDKRRGRL